MQRRTKRWRCGRLLASLAMVSAVLSGAALTPAAALDTTESATFEGVTEPADSIDPSERAALAPAAGNPASFTLNRDVLAGIFGTLETLPGPPEGPVPTPGYDPTVVYRQFTNGRLPQSGLYSLTKDCLLMEEMARRLRALFRAAAAAGYPMFAMSCYRTYDQQAKLYNDAVAAGRGVFVASPGRSNHGWGLAADIWPTRLQSVLDKPNWYDYFGFDSPEWKFLDANAARFGLIFYLRPGVIPEEPWHIEAVEVRR